MEEDNINLEITHENDEMSEEEPPLRKSAKKTATKPAVAKAPKSNKIVPKKASASKTKTLFIDSDEEIEEEIEEEEEEEVKPKKSTGRAAVLGTIAKGPAKKKTPAPKLTAKTRAASGRNAGRAGSKKLQEIEISDDDD